MLGVETPKTISLDRNGNIRCPPPPPPVVGGGGGEGGGTASLNIGTLCQTTALAFRHCPNLILFLTPPTFEGHRTPPPPAKKKKNQTFVI